MQKLCVVQVMDGMQAAAKIREIEKSLHDTPLPIVAVTAHAVGEFRDKCFAAGMQV